MAGLDRDNSISDKSDEEADLDQDGVNDPYPDLNQSYQEEE